MLSHGMRPLELEDGGWLRPVMFDPSSRIARDTACQMVRSLCDTYERTKAVSIIRTNLSFTCFTYKRVNQFTMFTWVFPKYTSFSWIKESL